MKEVDCYTSDDKVEKTILVSDEEAFILDLKEKSLSELTQLSDKAHKRLCKKIRKSNSFDNTDKEFYEYETIRNEYFRKLKIFENL